MIDRGVILAPSGTRIEVEHMFSSYGDDHAGEFGIGINGGLDITPGETGKDLCEAVLNGVMTLDQVDAMLVETAVDKACGNLSKAARMLGLTRPQLAYRLGRLHENEQARPDIALASSSVRPDGK
jgi:transcriptional regulator with GAF, ATPase, and Fis domain